ncbi:hypothetical protein M7I_3524 [Glarea lozoyensis 74030]|uniref:Uncharacterized protein n=1 Tax=Glarea lozoyensis (strain ATCC 74030 / MF5533) TaxID=1104152 RepID=H0ELQ5_GLAL7|nr:hypothetical protein M7I_3524 [Glarea lozoyensis 74030]
MPNAARLIYPTTEESAAALYNAQNITSALEALHQDGFVVLKSVVNVSHIHKINEYMRVEADDLLQRNAKPFNQGVNCK